MKHLLLLIAFMSQVMAYSFFDNAKDIDQKNLVLVHAIKDVVITTQKTRGLTNSFMNGNVVAQMLVYNQREVMSKNIDKIIETFSTIEIDPVYFKEASDIINSVKKLNKRAFKKESGEVFSTYTYYIEQWMVLNAKIIDVQFKHRGPQTYNTLVLLNGTLLPLTENIGKMRGMGSGIVARGTCKDTEAPKMQKFASEINRYKEEMIPYLKNHNYIALSENDLKSINTHVQTYTELTRSKVIGQEEIDLDANKFFDQGTACIKDVLKVYNLVADTLS